MDSNQNLDKLFYSDPFEIVKKYQLKHFENSSKINTSQEYKDFYILVESRFINLCERLYQSVPSQFASKNFYTNNQNSKNIIIQKIISPDLFSLSKYLDKFSLLYVEMNMAGIKIGFKKEVGKSLFFKKINISNLTKIQFIQNNINLFINSWFQDNCIYINKSKLNILNTEEFITEFEKWFQNYISLFIFLSDTINPSPNIINLEYNLYSLAQDTGFVQTDLERWIQIINRKGQVIFYGSPGTGKTYIAEKLAKHLISDGDGFSELVQFHPVYAYEDFIQGIRPQSQDGKLTYPLVPGRFLEFCKKAESRLDICVLIIDEINRANLAQVFGELMYLLEYRDREIPLAAGNTFRIPKNVRIIGTMNTADRSIAQIDHALRRRFAFIELRPNYDVLLNYHLKTGYAVEELIKILQELNQAIADKNYEIGISFFLTDNLRDDIQDIWQMEIEPYLEEYFFDKPDKVDEFRWNKIYPRLHI